MGVDAIIIAKQSKRFFYFDRRYNFVSWNGDDVPWNMNVFLDIDARRPLTAKTVERVAKQNCITWNRPEDSHRKYYNELIIKFARLFPNDEFFVVSDHDCPDFHDVVKADGLVEVTGEELEREQPDGQAQVVDLMRLCVGLAGLTAGAGVLWGLYWFAYYGLWYVAGRR